MSKRTWLPARSRLAFTLVELMVVITIIAVLAAILLPAIGNVMRYADNLQCRNNLKQIAMSVMSYTTDYQGAIPPTMVKRKGGKIYYWCNLLAMRDLAGENTAQKTVGGQLMRCGTAPAAATSSCRTTACWWSIATCACALSPRNSSTAPTSRAGRSWAIPRGP